MMHSITIHQNIGNNPLWRNPNVWPGDSTGQPVVPKSGEACYLWAKFQNDGSMYAQNVTISYYVCVPSTSLLWPGTPLGVALVAKLAPGTIAKAVCGTQWIPDINTSPHQCLVAVVSCQDCPPPPSITGTKVDASLGQVAQHNVTIVKATETQNVVSRSFYITNAPTSGKIAVTRVPLAANATVLTSRGIDPSIPEAPNEESLKIVRQSDGAVMGDNSLSLNAGESYDLNLVVSFQEIKPGTAAFYQVQQYEQGQLIGGVGLVVLH